MSTLYLIRHGQASFGTDNYDQLSPTGQEQVRQLGRYFADLGERIDHIYSGSLRRQHKPRRSLPPRLATPRRPSASSQRSMNMTAM